MDIMGNYIVKKENHRPEPLQLTIEEISALANAFVNEQIKVRQWQAIAEKLAEYLECKCKSVDCKECSPSCPMPKSKEIYKEDWIKEAKEELGYA